MTKTVDFNQPGVMIPELIRHTRILEIVGDTIRVKAKDVAFGDLAVVENPLNSSLRVLNF